MSIGTAFVVALAFTLAIAAVVGRADAPLSKNGYGVLTLEIAGSPERSGEIVAYYRAQPDRLEAFRLGLLLDSALFIPSYAITLMLGCRLAAGYFRSRGLEFGTSAGEILQALAVLAAILDYVENIGLYRQVTWGVDVFWWRWTLASSLAKWAIILIAVFYGVVALAWFLVGWVRSLMGP